MKFKKLIFSTAAFLTDRSLLAGCAPSSPEASPTPAFTLTPHATATPTPVPSPKAPAATATPTPIVAPAGWKLAWHDEFDGPAGAQPDPQNWGYNIGNNRGWGNAEDEYYTDSPDNAAMDGKGSLVITAKTESLTTSLDCWNGPCAYTSARLLTKGKFEMTYGRVEARLRLPYGQGVWPAFWMLGANIDTTAWPTCGEIDIMENIGKEPAVVHGSVNGPGYSGGVAIGGPYFLSSGQFSDDFHVFAVEWDPQEIRWYVDGQKYFSVSPDMVKDRGDWVFDHPFFLILNLAVGGGWPGDPDKTSTFPQTLTVDYVRVFQH